jgi:hypothetical protein
VERSPSAWSDNSREVRPLSFHQNYIYPRFLWGRAFIPVLLALGVTTDDLNSSPRWISRSFFSANSFEFSNNFCAAFAVLLGRFFAFAIFLIVHLRSHDPSATDNLVTIVKDRRLPGCDGALWLVEYYSCSCVRQCMDRCRRRFVTVPNFYVSSYGFRWLIESNPVHALRDELARIEIVRFTDYDLVFRALDLYDI